MIYRSEWVTVINTRITVCSLFHKAFRCSFLVLKSVFESGGQVNECEQAEIEFPGVHDLSVFGWGEVIPG